MNYDGFQTWLIKNKGMSERSAQDTVSRLRRVLRIIAKQSVSATTIKTLNETNEFMNLSMFVKSQLRRAVTLYREFDI